MTKVDAYSLTTVPIEPHFYDTPLGHATAFVWKTEAGYYLVTNWHVVSGKNSRTRENMRPDAARPNVLRGLYNVRIGDFGKRRIDINIRNEDDQPQWLIHPGHGPYVDIAVIPIPFPPHDPVTALYPINGIPSLGLDVQIGMDVFILGYPFTAKPPGFPVWKRGSIASEPDLVRLTTQYMLVDTASRPGMSGSPVIRRSYGNHVVEGGYSSTAAGPATTFIGIYSGRLHTDDKEEAQIGIVWPAELIEGIIIGGKFDE